MPEVKFTVPGKPEAKARPRWHQSTKPYTPKRTIDFEKLVAWCAKEAGFQPSNDYVEIEVTAVIWHWPGDLDNVVKAVLDGLGKAGLRDSRVVAINARYVWTQDNAQECTHVSIRTQPKKPFATGPCPIKGADC